MNLANSPLGDGGERLAKEVVTNKNYELHL